MLKKNLFLIALFLFIANSIIATIPYTIQDSDVYVRDGVISSCSLSEFPSTSIIIPDSLDGQLVTSIYSKHNDYYGVFSQKGIVEVTLPSSIVSIGDCAFSRNAIVKVNFAENNSLKTIGEKAFYSNSLSTIDFNGCNNLQTIGTNAFAENSFATGMTVPSLAIQNYLGWVNELGEYFPIGTTIINFEPTYEIRSRYVLQDEDVIVENGDIVSCISNLQSRDIIIPDTLDGQVVRGTGLNVYNGAFHACGLIAVELPSSMKYIGERAFEHNKIIDVDFSNCDSLQSIGRLAFSYNKLKDCNLTSCKQLKTIGYGAFNNNDSLAADSFYLPILSYTGFTGWVNDGKTVDPESKLNFQSAFKAIVDYVLTDGDVIVKDGIIESCNYDFFHKRIVIPETLDGQTIVGVKDAGDSDDGVFYNKGIENVQLPSTLKNIGAYAFASNNMTELDLSNCNKLETIRKCAFEDGVLHTVIVDGCDKLSKIGYGAFMDNRSLNVTLNTCKSLEVIDNYAFRNCNISTLTFSNLTQLERIGNEAFYDNDGRDLDFEGCAKLRVIGHRAFAGNHASDLNLGHLTSITRIEHTAFAGIGISTVNLNGCSKLEYIGNDAFKYNNLTEVKIDKCTSLVEIGYNAFAENSDLTGIVLPKPSYEGFRHWVYDFYTVDIDQPITNFETSYTAIVYHRLLEADLVVENGVIIGTSYDFYFKRIIIPETAYNDTIRGIGKEVFEGKDIVGISFPRSIRMIGESAFSSNSIQEHNLSELNKLVEIGDRAFAWNPLWTINFSFFVNLEYIGNSAFSQSNLYSVSLFNCAKLKSIGDNAFSSSEVEHVNLDGCTGLESIGSYAFGFHNLSRIDLSYCESLKSIGGDAFYSYRNKDLEFFTLPEVKYENSTWRIIGGETKAEGDTIFSDDFNYHFIVPMSHTLTNNDVVVENGAIVSCVDNIKYVELIVPDILDGQRITSIGVAKSNDVSENEEEGVFENKGLLSLTLPSSIETVHAASFKDNYLDTVYFQSLLGLKNIGDEAFYNNYLTNIDLTACNALEYVGNDAFYSNSFSNYQLPQNTTHPNAEWITLDGDTLRNWANTYSDSYFLSAWYTLTDGDVKIVDGAIEECDYEFNLKKIEIPSVLQGQTITKINGGFNNKAILAISLPVTVKTIGTEVFSNNKIDLVDLSNNHSLTHIYPFAFGNNEISEVIFGETSSLEEIGFFAFSDNNIKSLDFSHCTPLKSIGYGAFSDNSIEKINFENCNLLTQINNNAFEENMLDSVDLSTCSSLSFIGTKAFYENNIKSLTLPQNTKLSQLNWESINKTLYPAGSHVTDFVTYYQLPQTYILTDDDVVIVDGVLEFCSYNFEAKKIVIPQVLDGQIVKAVSATHRMVDYAEVPFLCKGITSLKLPATIELIGEMALAYNNLRLRNWAEFTELSYIGKDAFAENLFDTIDLSACKKLDTIGLYAFASENCECLYLPNNNQTIAWKTNEGIIYNQGETASPFNHYYKIPYLEANFEITLGDSISHFLFTDLSTIDIKSWKWNFGDGHTSYQQNPSHTYDESGIYDVTLTVCNEAWCDTFTIISAVDINEISPIKEKQAVKDIFIYPNPVKDILMIDAQGVTLIEVYSPTGQLVKKAIVGNLIDLSHLSAGVFLVRVSTESGLYVSQIIKL